MVDKFQGTNFQWNLFSWELITLASECKEECVSFYYLKKGNSQLTSRRCGAEYYPYISRVEMSSSLHIVKGTQDGETLQEMKIQKIF